MFETFYVARLRIGAGFIAAAIVALFVTSTPVELANAQRRTPHPTRTPIPRQVWCGVTSDAGTARLTLDMSGRRVESIVIRGIDNSFGISSGESGCLDEPVTIVEDAFAMRCRVRGEYRLRRRARSVVPTPPPGGSRRCRRAPCRPRSGETREDTVYRNNSTFLKGNVIAPDLIEGSYTALRHQIISRAGGDQIKPVRSIGTFLVWPEADGLCP